MMSGKIKFDQEALQKWMTLVVTWKTKSTTVGTAKENNFVFLITIQ